MLDSSPGRTQLSSPSPGRGSRPKDRPALGVLEHVERTGELKPGQTVVEATGGNAGCDSGIAQPRADDGSPAAWRSGCSSAARTR
jgi:hypothetical protein